MIIIRYEPYNKAIKIEINLDIPTPIWYNYTITTKEQTMKIIPTLTSTLHLEIQKSMRTLTEKQLKQKQLEKNREEFMKRVYETLGKNFIPSVK